MRFLLDRNVVTEVAKPRPNARLMNWLLAHELASGVPSIVIAERYKGAHDAPKEKRVRLLAEVDHFVRTFSEAIVPFDAEAARVWGEYISRPALKLKPRSYPDTQIAAIALSRGLTIVTRNTRDFPEVPVINPFED